MLSTSRMLYSDMHQEVLTGFSQNNFTLLFILLSRRRYEERSLSDPMHLVLATRYIHLQEHRGWKRESRTKTYFQKSTLQALESWTERSRDSGLLCSTTLLGVLLPLGTGVTFNSPMGCSWAVQDLEIPILPLWLFYFSKEFYQWKFPM